MALGTTAAIGLGAAALGGFLNARTQNKNARRATKHAAQQQNMLMGMMQKGPMASEQAIANMLSGMGGPMQVQMPGQISAGQVASQGWTPQQAFGMNAQLASGGGFDPTKATAGFDPTQASVDFNPQMASANFDPQLVQSQFQPERFQSNFDPQLFTSNFQTERADVGSYLQSGGFNTGQDALMQMLRADPRTKVDETLEGIMTRDGDAFNTSGLFDALQRRDERNMENQLNDFRGSFSGLGQRFGSRSQRGEQNLRAQLADDAALRNAQIGMQAFEAGKARQMQSAGMLTGREQFGQNLRATIGTQVQQGGLGAAGLQLQGVGQNNQYNLAGEQLRLAGTQANNQAMLAGEDLQLRGTQANNQAFSLADQLRMGAAGQNNSALAQQAGLGLQAIGMNNAALGQRQGFNLQALGMNNQNALAAAQLANSVVGQNNASAAQAAGLNLQALGQNNQALAAQASAGQNAAQINNASQQALAAQALQAAMANQGANLQAAGLNQQGLLQGQGLQLQANGQQQQMQQALLQMMLSGELGRMNYNAGIAGAGVQAGQPTYGPGYGGVVGDMGNALLMAGMMGRRPTAGNVANVRNIVPGLAPNMAPALPLPTGTLNLALR